MPDLPAPPIVDLCQTSARRLDFGARQASRAGRKWPSLVTPTVCALTMVVPGVAWGAIGSTGAGAGAGAAIERIRPEPAGLVLEPTPIQPLVPEAVLVITGAEPMVADDPTAGVSGAAGPPAGATGAPGAGGPILVTGAPGQSAVDPLHDVNRGIYAAGVQIDRALVHPLAAGYRAILPKPVRDGLHNALVNLREPVVFVNFLLQLKPARALATAGRFTLNLTLGVAGIFDIARRHPFDLPRQRNGFADTFGYYGIAPGPYLYLPVIGPTTVRDLIGGGLDRLVLPLTIGQPFTSPAFSIPAGVIGALDHRARIEAVLKKLRERPGDPYLALRRGYLARRQAEIDALRGRSATAAPASEPPLDRRGATGAAPGAGPPPAPADAAPGPVATLPNAAPTPVAPVPAGPVGATSAEPQKKVCRVR